MHLRCRIIKSVHPCTLLMASFGDAETSLLVNTCGIHAASAINAQRIISATDGGGIKQQRCFLVYKKLDVKRLYTDVQLFNIAARPD